MTLSDEEVKVLSDWLLHQYLPYDNPELHSVVRRLVEKTDELDRQSRVSTPRGGESS